MKKGYGWRKDHLDQRDHLLGISKPAPLPTSVDLRPGCPPVYDQLDLGSCTGNAIAAAVDFERKRQGEYFLNPSRLFIYYNERVMEGDVSEDAGAEIRDGIKSVASLGVCPESDWPYDEQEFATKPSPSCYTDALKIRSLGYSVVSQNAFNLKYVLAILKRPVIFGFSAFDVFESDAVAASGIVPMPGPTDSPIGGHAVLAVGYNDVDQCFIVRNSWGPDWGDAGYFHFPYAYMLDPNLTSDLWTILFESAPIPIPTSTSVTTKPLPSTRSHMPNIDQVKLTLPLSATDSDLDTVEQLVMKLANIPFMVKHLTVEIVGVVGPFDATPEQLKALDDVTDTLDRSGTDLSALLKTQTPNPPQP